MTTLADLKRRVIALLGDEAVEPEPPEEGEEEGQISSSEYSAVLLLDAINAGINAILPWVPKASVASITGNGTTTEFELPSDLYRIESVWDGSTYKVIPSMKFAPYREWADRQSELTWLDYPAGKITFSRALTTSGAKIFYSALWGKPTEDDSEIEPPEISHLGICLYAAGYTLLSPTSLSAKIRQFNTRVDSGTPEDNPLRDQSEYFMRLFETEMSRHPARERGQS